MLTLSFDRLRPALDEHERLLGMRLPAAAIDPRQDGAAETVRAFLREPFRIELGANDGEWSALRLGLKSLVREILPVSTWQARRPRYEAQGLLVEELPFPVTENPVEGFIFNSAERPAHPWWKRLFGRNGGKTFLDGFFERVPRGSATDACVVAYVGRSRSAIEQARAADGRMIPIERPPDGTALSIALGTVLGYPACCVHAYAALPFPHDNHAPIRAACDRSEAFDPLLNNLSLGIYHHIGWFPCRYDCEPSRVWAARLAADLEAREPERAVQVARLLAMPRLYLDDRRQLLFDRALLDPEDGQTLRYADVYTPFQFDRGRGTTEHDWIFYAGVAAPMRLGNALRLTATELAVERDGSVVHRMPRPERMLLVPFRADGRS